MSVSKVHSTEAECCPKFDPSTYTDGSNPFKIVTWVEKPFVKDGTWCCYYIPLGFGRAVTRALKKIEAAEAEAPNDEFMILSDCHSPWHSGVFVSCAKDKVVEGAETISGEFLAKAFEGDYSNIGKWMKEMNVLVKETLDERGGEEKTGVDAVKYYFYYPTCPKCAKNYGENHVVIMAKMS